MTTMTDDEVDKLIAKSLREGTLPSLHPESGAAVEKVIVRAAYHGVVSLLHAGTATGGSSTSELHEALHTHALGVAMHELGERQALARVIEALFMGGTRPILFKGAALAHSAYSDPATRERADADLLIDAAQMAAAHRILTGLGWNPSPGIGADFAISEKSYTYAGAGDATSHIDLHRQISNSQLLASLFTHDELWQRSIRLPALHPKARAPCPADALLIACMHRLVHLRIPYYSAGAATYSADRLIWLYDICLLVRTLSPEAWEDFVERAIEKGLAGACLDGLNSAATRLGSAVPRPVVERLTVAVARRESATAYLRASWFRRELTDLRAIRGTPAKLRFLFEVAFPPADYMRAQYRRGRVNWLPWLYLTRVARGIRNRLRGRSNTLDRKPE